jgi:hypothetical protein
MRTVRPGFRSSPGRDTIVAAESMSKHDHPGLGGTSPSDVSAKLPHVGHRSEILDGLIGRNKLVQQDGNHCPFVNQNTIRRELSKIVQGRVLFFHPQLLRCLTTEPNNVFHGVQDIDPFLSKMAEDPSVLRRPPMYGLFQAHVPTRKGQKVGRCNF